MKRTWKKNRKYILVVIMVSAVAGVFIFGASEKKEPGRDYRSAFARHYRIFSPELPAECSFAGEAIPLELYYVRESLDREILAGTFMHSYTQQMFKRAFRYFPVIEPILKRYKIPDDFKYLAIAESNLANVTSPAGAEGVWQFLPATARKYGLEVNSDIDERYNLAKATQAACRYLRDAYDTFGTWTLAAAAYNRGMDGIMRAVKSQKVSGYYDLYLSDEPARYIFRISAAKEIYLHPVKYGFYLQDSDFYPFIPTDTITVDTSITDLPAYALSLGINYRILREFNPWIQSYRLPVRQGRTYSLLLPREGALVVSGPGKKESGNETFFHDTLMIHELH